MPVSLIESLTQEGENEMTTEHQVDETVYLTHKMLEVVRHMTADPDVYTEKTKHFVRALNRAKYVNDSHWRFDMTEEDMETLVFLLEAATLNLPTTNLKTRFHHYLWHRSPLYRKVTNDPRPGDEKENERS